MKGPQHGRKKPARRKLRTEGKVPELRCMVVPVDEQPLLMPTSVMEEVIDYQDPLPMESAPSWLLGHIEWDNRRVPVFSFGALINATDAGRTPQRSKIMILKSLNGAGRVPYLGILLDDLPRPLTVKPEDLLETGDEQKSLGVFSRIRVAGEAAIIPDLDRLTHLVTHAAFGALPITSLDD